MTEYLVIFERADDGGWGAYVPDVPGVFALGTTRQEVTERINEALEAYACDQADQGKELPTPMHHAGSATTS